MRTLSKITQAWMLVGVVVLICAATLLVPTLAWAYDGNAKFLDTGWDIGDIGGSILAMLGQAALQIGLSFLDVAGEFFNTITGNNLFKEGINSTKFSNVYLFVGNLCEALKPAGYTVIGIFAGIEGLRIAKDSKGLSTQWMGLGVMETWLVFVIKFYVMYVLVNNAKALMLAIYGLITNIQAIISKTIQSAGFDNASVVFDSIRDYMWTITYSQGVGICVVIMIMCGVVLIVCAVTAIYVQILSVLRLFEIFILMAVSPICLSGAVSSITSSITKSYIKTFCSAVLQLSIILITVAIFGPLMSGISESLNTAFSTGNTGVETILKTAVPIVTSLSLFLMVKQSRQISDKLVAAGM